MLATHLRLLREKNGLTQKQVADMLNIDRSTYAYYESGKTRPDILTIAKLARLYRISTDFLLDVKPPTLQMELRDERMEYQSAAHPRVKYLSDLSKEEQDLILFYRQIKKAPSSICKLFMRKNRRCTSRRKRIFWPPLGNGCEKSQRIDSPKQ